MLDQLLVNARVHLRYFARNRLILALVAIVLAGGAFALVPSLMWRSSVGRFELLRVIILDLNAMAMVVVAALGLFAVSGHRRARSLKMVLTKPCSPEVWLGSVFIAAGIVAVCIYSAVLVLSVGFSYLWNIPYQSGFAYIIIDSFLRALIWLAWLTVLGVALHPVVAVVVAFLFNEGTIYQLKFMMASAIEAGTTGAILAVTGPLVDAIYFTLPMMKPLSAKTAPIYSSLRTATGDWALLVPIGGYTLLMLAFSYCLSDYLIRRKALI
jgi:ABC-type transport system involved in multi-copper enzyme maturation permease subunit